MNDYNEAMVYINLDFHSIRVCIRDLNKSIIFWKYANDSDEDVSIVYEDTLRDMVKMAKHLGICQVTVHIRTRTNLSEQIIRMIEREGLNVI